MTRAQQLKNIIKKSKVFGNVYFFMGILFVKFLQIFVRPDEKQILFMSYSGRQFSDTPKEAFNLLREDPEFKDYKLVWAFNNVNEFNDHTIQHKVSANSPLFFYHLLKSKYWIANSTIDRLIPFKHERNIYIQFWHGIPMKALGHAEIGLAPLVQHWYDHVSFDYLFTYSEYDLEKFKELFPKTKRFVDSGQLRKKIVERYHAETSKHKIKKELGITSRKPVLLYVPTFRGYESNEQTKITDEGLVALSEKYVVIYRGHYFSKVKNFSSIIMANTYSLNKLFMIADVLVTDYSSVFFDFAPYNKPIYLFQPDLAEYSIKRGLYFSAEKLGLPVSYTENELLGRLSNETYDLNTIKMLNKKFNPHSGKKAIYTLKNIISHT